MADPRTFYNETWDILNTIDDFNILQEEILQKERRFSNDVKTSDYTVTISARNPKAEFLILNKTKIGSRNVDLRDINIIQLVQVANSFANFWQVPYLVLSIHRGIWQNVHFHEDSHFHAHLSFGKRKYQFLEIFNTIVENSTARSWWNDNTVGSLTDYWSFGRNVLPHFGLNERHRINVLNNPYFIHKIGEFNRMKNLPSEEKASGKLSKMVEDDGKKINTFTDKYHIVYHPYQPQIGLAPRKGLKWSSESQRELIEDLEVFGQENVLRCDGTIREDEGYQICISLSQNAFTEFERPEGYGPVRGYIQVSGPVFYGLCPEDKQKRWWDAFRHWNGTVHT